MNLDDIRDRSRRCEQERDADLPSFEGWALAAIASAADVPALLAQLERERAAVSEALATVREQAAEMKRMHVEAELLVRHGDEQSEHDRLRREEVVAELTACRAALADALAVIASMSGEAT